MLNRSENPNAVVVYRSAFLEDLGVRHAFSTRRGGVSRAPFDSLDLSSSANPAPLSAAGREPEPTAENLRRFLAAIACPGCRVVTCRQVHGADVRVVDGEAGDATTPPAADALVTSNRDCLLVVRVADCVPILLADRRGAVVAAVHAGWRGVVAGVVPAAIEAMCRHGGVAPADLVAAVGPCIRVDAFEVGPEVAAAFTSTGLAEAVRPGGTPPAYECRPHIDLRLAVDLQLRRAGLNPEVIDHTDRCTFRDQDDFFSHRRDKGVTGRMGAAIAPRP